jgi:hypothetical protein
VNLLSSSRGLVDNFSFCSSVFISNLLGQNILYSVPEFLCYFKDLLENSFPRLINITQIASLQIAAAGNLFATPLFLLPQDIIIA